MITKYTLKLYKSFSSSLIPVGIVKESSAVNKFKIIQSEFSNDKRDTSSYYTPDGKLTFLKYDSRGFPKLGDSIYESFGVSDEANLNKIKEHYLLIVRNYHPDVNPEYLVSKIIIF